jgi:hypothetical protein
LAKFISINRSVSFFFVVLVFSLFLDESRTKSRFFEHADIFFVPMPMMMSVLDPGLLGSMSNMSMKESFAARLGQEELYVQVFDLIYLKDC